MDGDALEVVEAIAPAFFQSTTRARFLESVELARARFPGHVRLDPGSEGATGSYRDKGTNSRGERLVVEGRTNDPFAYEMLAAFGFLLAPLVAYAALHDRLPWAALVLPLAPALVGLVRNARGMAFRLELEGDTLRLTRPWPWNPRELVLEGVTALDIERSPKAPSEVFARTRLLGRTALLRGIKPRGLEDSVALMIATHGQWQLELLSQRSRDALASEDP